MKYAHYNYFDENMLKLSVRKELAKSALSYCGTLAYNDEELSSVLDAAVVSISESKPILMKLGLSLCHPMDQFNKKKGRELASADLDTAEVSVDCIGGCSSPEAWFDVYIDAIVMKRRLKYPAKVSFFRNRKSKKWSIKYNYTSRE